MRISDQLEHALRRHAEEFSRGGDFRVWNEAIGKIWLDHRLGDRFGQIGNEQIIRMLRESGE